MHFSINFAAHLALAALYASSALAQKDPERPNVVFVLTDDQDARMGSLSHMQQVQKHLIDEGTSFTKHFSHSALCCPSRLTLWSGQHAHNTNVTGVTMPGGGWVKIQDRGYADKYLPVWLSDHGYNTYYAGKLYNEHTKQNFDREGKYAAGWTESLTASLRDFLVHPLVYQYFDSTFQHNRGDKHDRGKVVKGYSTNLIADYTLGYIDDAVKSDKPFFAVAAPVAPHVSGGGPPRPEKKHNGKLSDLQVPRTPHFNPDEASGVLHIHDLAKITNETYLDYLDNLYQKRIESLQSVDDMVERIVKKLDDHGVLNNTYIIYTSDNGYHIGQHRMAPGKRCAFEEDVNVPLLVRGPGVAKGKESDLVTAHVDMAPTIMNMVGLKPDRKKYKLDGQGLEFPLVNEEDFDKAKQARGEHVNIEMWGHYAQEMQHHPAVEAYHSYKALRVRGEDYDLMYSVWCNKTAHELYDMTEDKYQMKNLYPNTGQKTSKDENKFLGRPIERVLDRLDALLLVQKDCKQTQCAKPWEQLHPGVKVANLKDALKEEHDDKYKKIPKVKYDKCVMATVYVPEYEGPKWDGPEGREEN